MSAGIVRQKKEYLSPSNWAGKFKNIPCFIMGNGPSINDIPDFSVFDSYLTVGINRIFLKYDPTILLWQDMALWIQHHNEVVQTKALKYVRRGADTCGGFYAFSLSGGIPKLTDRIDTLYGRGSSGTIAWQFVNCLGCDPVVLLGMDCTYRNKMTDFYGSNPMHKPHTLPNCTKGLQFINSTKQNKTIISCSDNNVFQKQSLEEAFKIIKEVHPETYNRQKLYDILLS